MLQVLIHSNHFTIARMGDSVNTVQRALIEQIRCSAQLRQQIGRQLADAIAGKRTTDTIRIKVPMPPVDAETDYAPNRNRGRRRFVLNGHSGENKGKVK